MLKLMCLSYSVINNISTSQTLNNSSNPMNPDISIYMKNYERKHIGIGGVCGK